MIRSWLAGRVVALAVVVAAQVTTGSVSGTVSDKDGRLPGVTIVVTSTDGARRRATTNASGQFRVDGIPAGLVRVEAMLQRYVTETIASLRVEAGRAVDWSPSLRYIPIPIRVPPGAPDSVESYVARLTGPNAKDCGTHVLIRDEAPLKTSLECVLTANRNHKAFRTMVQFLGVDSFIAYGLVGNGDGVILRFDYDSLNCIGIPGLWCEARFAVCPKPSVDRPNEFEPARFKCG